MNYPRPGPTRPSLADASRGDILEIRFVLFGLIRSRCWDLGLQPGDVLRHLGRRKGGVAVAEAGGRRILVPDECAPFVAVRSLGAWPDLQIAPTSAAEGAADPGSRPRP